MPSEVIFRKRTASVVFSICLGKISSPGHWVEKAACYLLPLKYLFINCAKKSPFR